jgi:hypothetical protein
VTKRTTTAAITGLLGFAAAVVFAVTVPRLKHRRNY